MKFWLCLLFLLYSTTSIAATDVDLNINIQLTAAQNRVGFTTGSSTFNVGSYQTYFYGYNVRYQLQGASFTKIDGSLPSYETRPYEWQYQKIDEYFSVAVRLQQICGYIYAPFNRIAWDSATCQNSFLGPYWGPTTWDSSIKITRKLVSGTYGKRILLGRFGVCHGNCSTPTQTIANVYLNYTITVPQSCEINAKNVVIMNFGNVSSRAFKTSGEKAQGINAMEKTIDISCNNIQALSNMKFRIQSDKASGNAIISNNADVGFVITDENDIALTPNSITSVIPFQLDDETKAKVKIKAYPVSLTGKAPAEGPVIAKGYLRVDFD